MAQTFEPDDLVRRAEGVRSLARRLVGDAHRAEDVIQDALATAVARPAPASTSAGAWFRGIVRNLARRARRDDARRADRDRRAAPPRSPSDPAAVVARAELHRMVVDSVLALDEPYRSTLLRRYFDGLSAAGIARELGVPSATVRTRIRRGLALLRERLDAERGGRRSWTLALLPLVAGAPGSAPPPPVPVTPLVVGATAMSAKKLAAVAVGLAVLGGVMLALRPTSTEPPPPGAAPLDTAGLPASGHMDAPDSSHARDGSEAASQSRNPHRRDRFRGRVLDSEGRPAAGVRILMNVGEGAETWETNADGEFDLAGRAGRHRILFDGGARGALLLFSQVIDGSTGDLELTLEPRVEVAVAVRSGSRGVEGVRVVLVSRDFGESLRAEAVTGPDGVARLRGLRPGHWALSARVLERTVWECDIDVFHGREWGFRVLLGGIAVLDGVVRTDGGEGVAGAVVTLETRPNRSSGRLVTSVETGIGGGYDTTVPRGMVKRFGIAADGFAPWPGPERQSEVVKSVAGLAKGERVSRNAVLHRGCTLGGVVRTEDGQAIAGIGLHYRLGWTRSGTVTTGSDGTFRVAHLNPGAYRLRVETPPWFPVDGQAMNVEVSSGDAPEPFDITVTRARRIEGIVTTAGGEAAPGAGVWLVNDGGVPIHGRSGALTATADQEGRFVIDDIPPRDRVGVRARSGTLRAAAGPVRLDTPPAPVAIRLEPTCTVRGRVVDVSTQSGVRGARVILVPVPRDRGVPKEARTNDRGEFEIEGMLPGLWKVTPLLDGYFKAEPQELLVPRSGEVVLTLGLDPGEVFTGSVVREDGSPVFGARVFVRTSPHGSEERLTRQARTDREGAFRLSAVKAGAHMLKASLGLWRMDPIELERGETDLRLVLRLDKRR